MLGKFHDQVLTLLLCLQKRCSNKKCASETWINGTVSKETNIPHDPKSTFTKEYSESEEAQGGECKHEEDSEDQSRRG